jgi:predicted flap endonuclease-1-like 5' DNA nuclease
MKKDRGLLLGLVAGVLIGFIIFVRSLSQQEKHELERKAPPGSIPVRDTEARKLRQREVPAGKATPEGASARKDRLEAIRGIGPVYARRLNEGGVYTFADLAALSTDQVLDIIGATRLPVEPEAWIKEARERSQRMD